MATKRYDFSLGNVTQESPKDLTQVKGHLACKDSMGTAVKKLKVERTRMTLQGAPWFPSQLAFGYPQLFPFSDLHLLPVSLRSAALQPAMPSYMYVKAQKALMFQQEPLGCFSGLTDCSCTLGTGSKDVWCTRPSVSFSRQSASLLGT